jgi:hypothetical protein
MPTPSSSPGDAPERQPPPASANATRLERAKVNLAYLALGSKATVVPHYSAVRRFDDLSRGELSVAISDRAAQFATGSFVYADRGSG